MKAVRIVACQTFQEEILKSLETSPDLAIEIMTFSPLCHKTPDDSILDSLSNSNTRTVILACPELEPRIADSRLNNNVKVYSYIHCCDLFMNHELINYFQQSGAYLATIGLLKYREKYHENRLSDKYQEIILLDTTMEPNLRYWVKRYASIFELPSRAISVGLSHLKLILANLLNEILYEEKLIQQTKTIQTLTNQALTVEIIEEFAAVKTQEEAFKVIKTLLKNFFAPQEIYYVPLTDQQHTPLSASKRSVEWHENNHSLSIALRNRDTNFGTLVLKEIMYPEYKEKYMNLLYQIIDISTFALSNVQTFDKMCQYERSNVLGEMASAIAHEIRNPMTTVRGYLQFLQNKQGVSEYKDQFNLMIEELDHANYIITEYLSLSKDRAIQPKFTNLNKVISSIYPLIKANTNQAEITINLDLKDIPDLLIDETEVRQLILNLTHNGLEAMKRGGALSISTTFQDNDILMEITDNGQGISPEIMPKLGTPFFTTKKAGTGLGLTVCFSIVNKYNGHMSFKSNDLGTTVSVRFPLLS